MGADDDGVSEGLPGRKDGEEESGEEETEETSEDDDYEIDEDDEDDVDVGSEEDWAAFELAGWIDSDVWHDIPKAAASGGHHWTPVGHLQRVLRSVVGTVEWEALGDARRAARKAAAAGVPGMTTGTRTEGPGPAAASTAGVGTTSGAGASAGWPAPLTPAYAVGMSNEDDQAYLVCKDPPPNLMRHAKQAIKHACNSSLGGPPPRMMIEHFRNNLRRRMATVAVVVNAMSTTQRKQLHQKELACKDMTSAARRQLPLHGLALHPSGLVLVATPVHVYALQVSAVRGSCGWSGLGWAGLGWVCFCVFPQTDFCGVQARLPIVVSLGGGSLHHYGGAFSVASWLHRGL